MYPSGSAGGGRTCGRYASCAGMVQDGDRLLPKAAELVGDKAGDDVRATTGSTLGDDPDRPGRITGGQGLARQRGQRQGDGREDIVSAC